MTTYTQGAYDQALANHEAAADALAAARLAVKAAQAAEAQAAEAEAEASRQLADHEAYPGISAWGHQAAYAPGGELAGRACGLGPACKIHGPQEYPPADAFRRGAAYRGP